MIVISALFSLLIKDVYKNMTDEGWSQGHSRSQLRIAGR